VELLKKYKKKNNILWDRVFLAIFIVIILIFLISTLIGNLFDKSRKKTPISTSNASSENSSNSANDNTINANYDYITVSSEEIHKGNLILVNNTFAYEIGEPEDLVSVYEKKTNNYAVKDTIVSLKPEVITALNEMTDAFFAEKNNQDLMVISGFRSKEYQQKLYDEDLAQTETTVSTFVAIPGHSEHHTGYAVDFGIRPKDGNYPKYDGKGDFVWVSENCYKFGFIVRYNVEKASLTGIADEPWHFRYVGKPHAFLMNEKKLCYEEYVDYIKTFKFGEKHLEVTTEDNKTYEIYYVPAEETTTKIPFPKYGEYEISGNNVDGFIITVTPQ